MLDWERIGVERGLTWVPALAEDEVADVRPLDVVRAAAAEVGVDAPAAVGPVRVVVSSRVTYRRRSASAI